LQTISLPLILPLGVGVGKINLSKSTFLVLFLAVGFMVGMSFSSVYAGVPWDTSEIADDAITSEKIKDRQVKNRDIKSNIIKSGKIRDGTITSEDIADDVIKSAVVLRAGNGTVPVGGKGYIGMDHVYSFNGQAVWILPFEAEITDFSNLQANTNSDTTTTYRLFTLGNVEVMSCSTIGPQVGCSVSGSVTVFPGFPLWVEVEPTCAGTCPSVIVGISSSIGFKPA